MPHPTDDRQFLEKQYQDSSNLDARIHLHQRFSVNKLGWQRWVFDQFSLPPKCRILELGCGPGSLWLDNLNRIPAGWEILLSDFSAGMLADARRNLGKQPAFQFKVIDAQSIPFEDAIFDAVIANHMLYHVPDRPAALAEIRRVLKPAGTFYASTVGERHLTEIDNLIRKFDPGITSWGRVAETFILENGMAQLSAWFTDIKLFRYVDTLEVTEVSPFVEYIFSGWSHIPLESQERFRDFVACEMESCGGVILITKDSGLFVSVPKGA